MIELEFCSCGLARYVVAGGVLVCMDHCDGPDPCRSNPAHCDQCRNYAKALADR